MNPDSAKNATVTAPLAATNLRFRNKLTSSMGWRRRRSTARNPARIATPAANPAMVRPDPQPASGASMIVKIRAPIPAADMTSPAQSTGGAVGSRDGGTTIETSRAIPAATGAMNRNTLPHQNRSRSQPPMIGPNAIPTPVVAPHSPIARARSALRVKMLEMIDRVAGKISAAPRPITAGGAGQAGCPEQAEAGHQDPLSPKPVAQAAGGQDQRREDQAVGIHHPLQIGDRRVELADQARQGHVHDGGVEADHKGRHAEGDQRRASPVR